MQSRIFRISF